MKKHLSPPPAKFSALAYLCLCLNAAALKYYELSSDESTLSRLSSEDALIEDLTAILLFSASTLLFVTGWMERKSLRRWIYVVGGIVLLFIAGEEISWGQRIFGYPTPDWIAERNRQGEFNAHNLNAHNLYDVNILLQVGFRYGVQLLCMMACAAFFTGRERIWGIPVPSMLLTLGLLTIFSYDYNLYFYDLFVFTLGDLSRIHNTLICLIIIFALFCRQYELLILSAAAILLPFALAVVNHIRTFPGRADEQGHGRFQHEVVEYLIAFGIFCYILEIFLNRKPFIQADHWVRRSTPDRASIGLFFRRLAHSVGRRLSRVLDPHPPGNSGRPFWLAISALSISMSIGLMSSAYVASWSRETSARNLAQEIAAREPIIRSRFNVYLSQNRIVYHKNHCLRQHISKPFFLYVIPTDPHESPIARRFTFFEYGEYSTVLYRNASYWDGVRRRKKAACFLVQPLPRWEIAGIGTGQESEWGVVTPVDRHADDGGGPADRFERDAGRSITRAHHRMYNAVVSREPRGRSDFDIYLQSRILIFVKEPCMRADIEAAFFLHVIPVDNASLPSYRQEHRFDNLDFRFSDFGRVFDDKCMASVLLPTYDMSRIRTGQYTSEKNLWQVEFPFHK